MVVVLIGGSSNVGKTTAARDVARRLGAAHVSIDDHIPPELAASSPFRDEMIWNSEREDLLAALRAQTAQTAQTAAARDSAGGVRYRGLPEDAQRAVAIMNADYAQWIRAEAESNRQPWISSQPWSTLAARVIDAAGLA